MVEVKFDKNQQKFAFSPDMSSSFFINKDLLEFFTETPDGKLLLPTRDGMVLVLSNWGVIDKVIVLGGITLCRHLLLPGFDINTFPFVLKYG